MTHVPIHRPDTFGIVKRSAEQVVESINAAESKVSKDGDRSTGIRIPKPMSYGAAIRHIEAHAEAEATRTDINHTHGGMHAIPALIALQHLLEDAYGCSFASGTPGMFGDSPPRRITVPLTHDTDTTICLGNYKVGDMHIQTGATCDDNGVMRARAVITVANKDVGLAEDLISRWMAVPDCWAGKTLTFDNTDEELRIPKIVQPTQTMDSIALNPPEKAALSMFVNQIQHHNRLRSMGIPFKRGVLFYGPWGTGKTLAASVAMRACNEAGITVIQERSWSRLSQTMHLARTMQPCLVFIEDIELATNRSIINMLDDATLKHCEVSFACTTNNPERLEDALTRTGRLDICIEVALPEAEARAQILAINDCPYFNSEIEAATDKMTGSDLAEIAKRARISALAADRNVIADDVLAAAVSITRPPKYQQPNTVLDALDTLREHMTGNLTMAVDGLEDWLRNRFE